MASASGVISDSPVMFMIVLCGFEPNSLKNVLPSRLQTERKTEDDLTQQRGEKSLRGHMCFCSSVSTSRCLEMKQIARNSMAKLLKATTLVQMQPFILF